MERIEFLVDNYVGGPSLYMVWNYRMMPNAVNVKLA